MNQKLLAFVIVAFFFVCESCNANFSDGFGDGDNAGDTDQDGDTDSDGDSDDDSEICDEEDIEITPAPARLMILMDMSGSMDPHWNDKTGQWDDPDNPGRWSIARKALIYILDTFGDGDIEFGLDFFPNSGNPKCHVSGDVFADVAPNQAKSLKGGLPGNDAPDGRTPLYCAMANFLDPGYASYFSSIEAESFLLVVSDGTDTCDKDCPDADSGSSVSGEDLGNVTSDLLDANIRTFVIGFGGGVDTDQLDAIARNGGTDFDAFLPADDQTALEDAMTNVTSSIISCVYDVGTPDKTADDDKVNFYIDDEPVAFDENCTANTGWIWANSERTLVRFCEKSCESFQDGKDHDIAIKWGCPADVPPL